MHYDTITTPMYVSVLYRLWFQKLAMDVEHNANK